MDMYLALKWAHIVSSTILFGTGLGIAFFQWSTYRKGDVHAIASVARLVVRADFVFTTPAVIVQLATGLALVHLAVIPWTTAWVMLGLGLFVVVGACWIPVVKIQVKLAELAARADVSAAELPEEFHRGMRAGFRLGWPAFIGMLLIFWLMVAKPVSFGT
jgi:uncharacterized membrane protein